MTAAVIMHRVMIGLTIQYVVIACGFALAKDWPRSLYFVSATLINVAVILMR